MVSESPDIASATSASPNEQLLTEDGQARPESADVVEGPSPSASEPNASSEPPAQEAAPIIHTPAQDAEAGRDSSTQPITRASQEPVFEVGVRVIGQLGPATRAPKGHPAPIGPPPPPRFLAPAPGAASHAGYKTPVVDGRVRNPTPSKLQGKTNDKDGNFAVMHMDVRSQQMSARDIAAKRSSEMTQQAAQEATRNGYQPVRPSDLKWRPPAPPRPTGYQPLTHTQPPQYHAPPRPLGPTSTEVKVEQARLLTFLRSLHPVLVVDQLCKALAYFGGIPGAPPPVDGTFPPSARYNGPGSVFVGWMSEIFPPADLSQLPNPGHFGNYGPGPVPTTPVPSHETPSSSTTAAGQQQPQSNSQHPAVGPQATNGGVNAMHTLVPKKKRGRPKGSKSSKPRKDKGISKGPKSGWTQLTAEEAAAAASAAAAAAAANPAQGVPTSSTNGEVSISTQLVEIRTAPTSPLDSVSQAAPTIGETINITATDNDLADPDASHLSTPGSKKKGRPKGTKNKPRPSINPNEPHSQPLSTKPPPPIVGLPPPNSGDQSPTASRGSGATMISTPAQYKSPYTPTQTKEPTTNEGGLSQHARIWTQPVAPTQEAVGQDEAPAPTQSSPSRKRKADHPGPRPVVNQASDAMAPGQNSAPNVPATGSATNAAEKAEEAKRRRLSKERHSSASLPSVVAPQLQGEQPQTNGTAPSTADGQSRAQPPTPDSAPQERLPEQSPEANSKPRKQLPSASFNQPPQQQERAVQEESYYNQQQQQSHPQSQNHFAHLANQQQQPTPSQPGFKNPTQANFRGDSSSPFAGGRPPPTQSPQTSQSNNPFQPYQQQDWSNLEYPMDARGGAAAAAASLGRQNPEFYRRLARRGGEL